LGTSLYRPFGNIKTFSGRALLRETNDEELLKKELEELGYEGNPIRATNPWYCRKKGAETWIKIGESAEKRDNLPVSWDTTRLENGEYQVLGLMHVWVKKDRQELVVARENIVNVVVEN
jgi:hypothetical protein